MHLHNGAEKSMHHSKNPSFNIPLALSQIRHGRPRDRRNHNRNPTAAVIADETEAALANAGRVPVTMAINGDGRGFHSIGVNSVVVTCNFALRNGSVVLNYE